MAGYIGANTSSVTNNQNAAERRKKFTFTANTTVLSGLNFAPQKIHIFHNGIRLVRTTDYTEAADGKSVTLVNAAQAGDEVVAVTFAQAPSTGGYSDADVDAHLLDAGVTLDATNDRVGVNTATPSEALEVDGVIQIDRTGDHPAMRFVEDGSNTRAYLGSGDWAINGLANDDFGISSSSTGDLVLGTGAGTERLRIDNSGRVTTPNQPIFGANRQGIADLTAAQVINWSVLVNQGNHFSTSTNRFTCPVAGKYYCSFFSLTNTGGTSAASYVTIRKNGSAIYSAYNDTVSSVNYLSYSASGILDCAANDLIDFYNVQGTVYANNYSGGAIYLIG